MIWITLCFVLLTSLLLFEHRPTVQQLWREWVIEPRIPVPEPKILRDPEWRYPDITASPKSYPDGGITVGNMTFSGLPMWKILGVSPSEVLADIMHRQTLEGSLEFKFRLAGDPRWHVRKLDRKNLMRMR